MKESSSPRPTRLVLLLTVLALCVTSMASARGPEATYPLVVAPGWNLLALPASVGNGSRAFLFPAAVSSAYVFRPSAGYITEDTLHHGTGFWLKFALADTVLLEGVPVFKDTVDVNAGWNIIGPLSHPLSAAAVVTEPAGIITSQFFAYVPGGGISRTQCFSPASGTGSRSARTVR